jgi:ubiquinone/menaquinone biosynthesis C-methylase UbiE
MEKSRICPWWMGYMLLIPFRKFSHNPNKMLGPFLKQGMNVLDYGCAMGYFSLPMAKMTGDDGKVYCVDIQEKMLAKLQQRSRKARLDHIINPLLAGSTFDPVTLTGQIDFTLLFYVVHEIPDKEKLFNDVFSMTKRGGKVLFAEPSGHVSAKDFKRSVHMAISAGFAVSDEKLNSSGLSVVLVRQN